jgi:acetolactate synthase I/II/III large subunit
VSREMNGAELISKYLVAEGVPYVFGVSGHGNVGMLNELLSVRDQIQFVSVHHEQVAGHMADAFFRVAHRPVATLTSTGPGSANLPMSLATALTDSSAFLAITGNIPTSQFNRGPFQELNRHYQAEGSNALRPFTKRVFHATRVEMLPTALRQAFNVMLSGKPGPVNLDVPYNLFVEECEVDVPDPGLWRSGRGVPAAAEEDVERTIALLRQAERPLLLAGNGVTITGAGSALQQLAQSLDVPVAFAPNGKGVIDSRNRLSLGCVGRNGTLPANQAARECDVLVAIGVRFDDRISSAWIPGATFNIPPTRLVHIDIDADEVGRNYPPTVGIIADARTTVHQLLVRCNREGSEASRSRSDWWRRIEGWRSKWNAEVERRALNFDVPIRPELVMREMRRVVPEDALVLTDSGSHHNWMVQFWETYQPGTLIQTHGFASMGFAVCGVLGAKLAAPHRVALALCGDGGMLMTPQVIPTAVEYEIPVVWVVWNNNGYGAIRDLQKGIWEREYGTSFRYERGGEPYRADFPAMAESFGATGVRVTDPGSIADAVKEAIESAKPSLIEIPIDASAAPPSVGSWQLPPLPAFSPNFGE